MIDQQIQTMLHEQMQKSFTSLQTELEQVRTGRAHPGLIENLRVLHYGSELVLKHIASITVMDTTTLSITAWDATAVASIEKAIRTSDLSLNPNTVGHVIRITLPALTQERRYSLSKLVKKIAEKNRASVRNHRQDAMKSLKEFLKQKEISEDDEHRIRKSVQDITDQYIGKIDALITAKEAELMNE